MNYEEAKAFAEAGNKVFEARYDGRVWSAGRMVDVGGAIEFCKSEEDAKAACADYELMDFDSKHLYTSVEVLTAEDFAE